MGIATLNQMLPDELRASSGAQVASSFDQLRLLVKTGDTVTVQDARGSETSGKISTLTSSSLALLSSAGPREFTEADVACISLRRADSVSNGARWGLLAGLGGAGAMLAICGTLGDCDPSGHAIVEYLAFFGAVGTGAGVGIDAAIVPRQLIFERPTGAAKIGVSPLLARSSQGVAVSIRF